MGAGLGMGTRARRVVQEVGLDVTGAINGPRELEFREPNHSNDHLTSDLTTDLTSNFWNGRDGVDMSKLKIIRSLKNGR